MDMSGLIAQIKNLEFEPDTDKLKKELKAVKSTRSVSLIVILAVMTVLSAAAYAPRASEAPPAAAPLEQVVRFPANEEGKTEYSADVFAAEFSLAVSLPAGIAVDADGSLFPGGIAGTFSNLPIVDSGGNQVGCVGYNVFDSGQADGAAEPMMIYNQICLGNHYRFTISEQYEVINDDDTVTTAVTGVYNDLEWPADKDYTEADCNYGVVAYSKTLAVYAAFDLDKNFFTREQCEEIAGSITIFRE
jgi:hypothetical protein